MGRGRGKIETPKVPNKTPKKPAESKQPRQTPKPPPKAK